MTMFEIEYSKNKQNSITVITATTNTEAVRTFYKQYPSPVHKIIKIRMLKLKG